MATIGHTVKFTRDSITLDGEPSTMDEVEAILIAEGWQPVFLSTMNSVGDSISLQRTVGVLAPRPRRVPFWRRWWRSITDTMVSWTT